MRPGESGARLVSRGLRLQPVRHSVMGRGTRCRAAGGQQDRRGDAHRALVGQQHVVGTAAVADVLMDVDDRVGRFDTATVYRQAQSAERGTGEELPAVHD